MIGPSEYLAFAGISLLVICTPGQDTALTIRNTLLGWRKAGVATALGVAAGQATWTVAASAGLSVLLTASQPLFTAIKIAGAGYLIYLGMRSLVGALRPKADQTGLSTGGPRLPASVAFRQGFLSNLSNAKMVVFFTSLLPQFGAPHPTFLLMLALGFNFCLWTLAWLSAYAFAVDRMRRLFGRVSVRRAMDTLVGAVLVGLGLRLGAESL